MSGIHLFASEPIQVGPSPFTNTKDGPLLLPPPFGRLALTNLLLVGGVSDDPSTLQHPMENGVQRWLVDISDWNPSQEELSTILSALPPHEHSCITRFFHFIDRKRAFVSRLLQYALVHQATSLPFHQIIIKRTPEGKPYLEHTNQVSLDSPNFSFNTSHDGDYVGIASEPSYIVGLDIVSLVVPKEENTLEFVKSFSSHFTENEWADIVGAATCDAVLAQFCRYWCLKEAYIKAIGAGFGSTLNRLEFKHTDWENILVSVDGEESTDWEFSLYELGTNHWVSIARGHPRYAVESYKRTLRSEEVKNVSSNVPFATSFLLRTVEQLLPASFQDTYSNHESKGKPDE